jgi:hypothetical protein
MHGLGAALMQKDSMNNISVVMFASKSLTDTESRYSTWEVEALCCVWAVTGVFKQYLRPPFGGQFKLFTDNVAVSKLFDPNKKKDDLNARLCHWIMKLSEYDYTVHHRSGASNAVADHLSRCPLINPCPYGDCDSIDSLYEPFVPAVTPLPDAPSQTAEINSVDTFVFRRKEAERYRRNG